MKYVVWTAHILVALLFLSAGVMKLITPYEQALLEPSTQWVEEFTPSSVVAIGSLEVLGVIGLIVPMFISRIRFLVPLSASALGVMMIMAGAMLATRGEPMILNLVIMALCFLVAYWRREPIPWLQTA